MSEKKDQRPMWQFPWGYAESFIITLGLLLVGFILELVIPGQNFRMPSYPINIIILVIFITYIVGTHFFFKGPIMSWLSSVPAAMAVMTIFTILVLFMGFIPQEDNVGFIGKIGLNHVATSKPYIVITVFLLTILGYTIIRRLTQKLTLRNFAFFLNHAGLFIILSAASIGSGDMLRLRMPVMQNETTNRAFPDEKHMAQLPFSIHLDKFFIDEYPPEIIVFETTSDAIHMNTHGKHSYIEPTAKGKTLDYNWEILQFLSNAVPQAGSYVSSDLFGSTHAALVKVTGDGADTTGWISCGNFMYPASFIMLSDRFVMGMTIPAAKKFTSQIDVVRNNDTIIRDRPISVNDPLSYDGWKIYQHSYSSEAGRWSQMSVFELVRDPWLPVVYIGIFMVLLGSIYLLWVGRKL